VDHNPHPSKKTSKAHKQLGKDLKTDGKDEYKKKFFPQFSEIY